MDLHTLQLLQEANPWLADPRSVEAFRSQHRPPRLVPRIVPKASSWPVPEKAHLLIGARQSGKTTYLWGLLRGLPRPHLHLNAEEPLVRAWCHSPTLFARDLRGLVTPDTPVLIDESQHLDEAGLFAKGLIDLGLPNPLFVTGSSSYHLRSKTRDSLAGRATRALIHPFSLAEVTQEHRELAPLIRRMKAREAALRQASFGAYPDVWQGDRSEATLIELREAFLLRDASDLFHVKDLDAFRRLLQLIAGQVGSLVNTSEWASICGVSRPTIESYLDVLVECHLVRRVRPFSGGRRGELTRSPKIYFCDNGMLSASLGRFEPFAERLDRGSLLENWVAAELFKHLDPLAPGDELRYWRSKGGAEVNFVLERPAGLVGVEVKASERQERKLTRSARSFIAAYEPASFLVVGLGAEGAEKLGACAVRWIGPEELEEAVFGQEEHEAQPH
jgi:uncharacterized protein